MKLYIKVQDGKPVGNPATEENLLQAFPGIDLNDPECGFVEFHRVPPPPLSVYHVQEGMIYMKSGDVFTDIYPIRNMTPAERIARQEHTKQQWEKEGFAPSWVFDEELCAFVAPVPMPNDPTRLWQWDEETVSWVDVTPPQHNE